MGIDEQIDNALMNFMTQHHGDDPCLYLGHHQYYALKKYISSIDCDRAFRIDELRFIYRGMEVHRVLAKDHLKVA